MVMFVAGFLGSAILTVLKGIHSDMSGLVPVPRPGERVNVLFLGLDAVVDSSGKVNLDVPLRSSRSRTDTMILISFDPAGGSASLISIPRDTRVEIPAPGRSWDKINAAHVYGGPLLAMRSVEKLLDIPVHYYVRTNFQGVLSVVNILGGVEIDVETDMRYSDPYQGLAIDLKRGLQTLDGDKALQYLRYRNGGGDIARIQRQQKFIAALLRRVVSFNTVLRAQALAREVVKYIDTNMTTSELFDFVRIASQVTDPNVEMATLPGDAKYITDPGRTMALSYWVLRENETDELVAKLVWGIDREQNAAVTVRVLNGTDVAGLGAEVASRLRADGFNVVQVANAPSGANGSETRVVMHTEDQTPGKLVARSVMRLAAESGLYKEIQKDLPYAVTVIVGSGFKLSATR
ncbi:MAG: LCP family protein [Bacillota bacterium]|nr:LCP family protein [Bacillota bacterium]